MYNGIVTTAFDLYNVKVTGQNAHGSQPQNGHDAILALAQFIVNAQQIVARRVNPLKTAIVSIGVIKGGEAVNIIPSTASLEMVCRTYGEETRKVIYDEVMRLARGTEELSGCKFDVEHTEGYGSVVNDPKLLKIGAEAVAEALGPDYVDNLEEPLSFSEDFSYYGNATGTPSLFCCSTPATWATRPTPCTTPAAPSRRRRSSAASRRWSPRPSRYSRAESAAPHTAEY